MDAFLERARASYEPASRPAEPAAHPSTGDSSEKDSSAVADGGAERATSAPEPPVTSAEIRRIAFDLKRKGYSARYVDAAMDRLEEVFFERERRTRMAELGEDAWWTETQQLLSEVRGRLERPAGKKFRRRGLFASGYRRSEVDAFLELVTAMLHGDGSLTTAEVRGAVFHTQWRGYHEDQVDALLDSIVVLMLSVR